MCARYEPVARELDNRGLSTAFPIQTATLPSTLAGRDVLGGKDRRLDGRGRDVPGQCAVAHLEPPVLRGPEDVEDLRPLQHAHRAGCAATDGTSAPCVDAHARAVGGDAEADALRVRVAARNGPILQLLQPCPDYDLSRLVHERTLSINTAAAGGNASLMAMGA